MAKLSSGLGLNSRLGLAPILAIFVSMSTAAADDTPVTPSATDLEFIGPQTSIDTIMVAVVDWSAHEIWETSYAETLSGRDWQSAKQSATKLLAAGTLVSLGGTGSRDDEWVKDPAWQEWTAQMIDETKETLRAIEAQDQFRLVASGERLVETCEGCHDMFRPDTPPEGLMHVPHHDYGDPLARD